MRRLVPWITVLAIYVVMPLSAEVTENAVHLVVEGHLAHGTPAAPDAEGHDGEDEHGCSGTFHVCACHVASLALPVEDRCAPPGERPAGGLPARLYQVAEGHAPGPFRPPIA